MLSFFPISLARLFPNPSPMQEAHPLLVHDGLFFRESEAAERFMMETHETMVASVVLALEAEGEAALAGRVGALSSSGDVGARAREAYRVREGRDFAVLGHNDAWCNNFMFK